MGSLRVLPLGLEVVLLLVHPPLVVLVVVQQVLSQTSQPTVHYRYPWFVLHVATSTYASW